MPDRDRKVGLLAAAAGAVVVALAVLGVVLLVGNSGDDVPAVNAPAGSGSTPQPSDGTAGSSGSTDGSETPAPPTASELEDYARTYIQTASTDPTAGFRMLTASYQRRSPRYQEFWGSVSGARILDVSADPAAMQVTYTYRYRLADGGRPSTHTDRVTLILVQKGDQILIADATYAPA